MTLPKDPEKILSHLLYFLFLYLCTFVSIGLATGCQRQAIETVRPTSPTIPIASSPTTPAFTKTALEIINEEATLTPDIIPAGDATLTPTRQPTVDPQSGHDY